MAVLNVKNFPDNLYKKIKSLAKKENRSISQEVIFLLTKTTNEVPNQSILSLRGLGKEIWEDIDVDSHIKKERDEWS